MLGLKGDTSRLNISGQSEFKILEDLSTRVLQTVSVGEEAGKISRGEGNAFVGYQAGKQNTIGSFGVFVGFQAGQLSQNSDYNTFVGAFAGRENNHGFRNTFVGFQAGQLNKDGSDCTGVGAYSLRENTTGNRNVAVGNRAGERILDGDNNTMIGMESGQDIRSGNNNTMAGYRSGRASFRNNENTYFGAYAGYSNSFGDGNAFVGYRAGQNMVRGNFNVAVGTHALLDAQYGDCNIAIGAFAGSITTGCNNVFVGSGAGTANQTGNNNTLIGNNAGFDSQGSDNVYIGKDAAYSLTGNKNVVVGVQAYRDIESSSSVVIGYRGGDTIFDFGDSNILIGINADTYAAQTRNAIVIGSKNARAFNESISIGENINNGGSNSLSIGYDLNVIGDKTILVGNKIDIKGVNVFNDPLNSRFPIRNTQNYAKFNFTESYTDTLFLNGVSNEFAIATLNTINEYDSYTNRRNGTTLAFNINLLTIFQYNVLYQSKAFYYDGIANTTFNITDYFLNPINSNNLRTTNFDKSNLFLNTSNLIIDYGTFNLFNNVNNANDSYQINISGNLLPYLVNNTITSNLIPYNTPSPIFTYTFDIVKRNAIYKTVSDSNYYIPFEYPLSISTTSNKVLSSGEVDNLPFISYNRFEYLDTEPLYGSYSNKTYKHFKGAYFSSNDRLKIGIVNKIQGSNTYYIVSSNDAINTHFINYHSNSSIFINSNIYVFPNITTVFDRSYFHVHPACNMIIDLYNSNNVSNVQLRVNDTLGMSFSNIVFGNSLIELTPSGSSNLVPLEITLFNSNYGFNLIYLSNLETPQSSRGTIPLTILPATLISYSTNQFRYPPLVSDMSVIQYPSYGSISYASNSITYTPGIMNIDNDLFTILCKYNSNEIIYYDVNVTTSNVFSSIQLNKMQEPIVSTINETLFSNTITTQTFTNLFRTLYTSSNITSNNPYGDSNTFRQTFINIPLIYNCNVGYIITSNDISRSLYSQTTKPISLAIPNSNDVINNQGHDYFIYNPYPPYRNTSNYFLTSNIPIITSSIITSNLFEIRSNNSFPFNRYYNWNYSIQSIQFYARACNLTVTTRTSNIYTDHFDLYNNYIFTSSNTFQFNITSNHSLITNTSNLIQRISYSNLSTTTQFITSNMPTIQLNRAYVYQYNGTYQVNSNITSRNLVFLQKNIGPVHRFHQSNINAFDIHLWNTQPSDQLASNKVTSNVYFTDGKSLTIDYFKYNNTPLTLSLPGTPTTSLSIENYVPSEFNFQYVSTYTNIAIQHTSNISFVYRQTAGASVFYNSITTLNPELGDVYAIADPKYKNDAFIDYINYNVNPGTGVISYGKPIRKIIPTSYLRNFKTFYNIGISSVPTKYIASNELYYSIQNPTVLYYKVNSTNTDFILKNTSNDLNVTDTFTPQDILDNKISVYFKKPNPTTASISLQIYDNSTLLKTITYETSPYHTIEYIQPRSNQSIGTISFLDFKNTYQQTITGIDWNEFSLLNSNVNATFTMTKPPHKGFLSKETIQPLTRMPLSNLLYDTLYYIPYTPMQYENDTMKGIITYTNTQSPEYTFTIKNYRSVWNDLISKQNMFYATTLPRSAGMIADNVKWLPTQVQLNPGINNITWSLNTLNITIPDTIQYIPITKQPKFIQTSITITVDSGNYNSLQSLLTCLNDPTQDVNFYIINPPTRGILLDNFEAKTYVTSFNIRNRNGFYQHYGESILSDQFTLRVGTTPYDISLETLTVIVNVTNQPFLLRNNYQYVYFNTLNAMSNTYNLLNSNILQITDGSLFVYDKNNIDVFRSNSIANTYDPISLLTKTDLDTNQLYYRPNADFFRTGSNLNQDLSLKFSINSSSNINEANKLLQFDQYNSIYNFEWISRINTYESINNVVLQQPNNQTIRYVNNNSNNPTSNVFRFDNKTEFLFDFKPFQRLVTFPDNPSLVKTYYFTFELTDKTNINRPLLQGIFTHSNISIYSLSNEVVELPTIPFDNTSWNTFNIINYDPVNNNDLSILLNQVNYTKNLNFKNLPLQNVKDIVINLPVQHPFNYFDTTLTSNVIGGTPNVSSNIFYYNLRNYNTQVHFRNFNVYISGNIDLATANITNANLFNIAIGDDLDVVGINNICLGKNFKTQGEGSIILGTDIGVNVIDSTITNNEIFNSIIISNDSFRNSIVRDVISIGNNILNDTTDVNIEEFLSKRPVLIGNDITSAQIDFHINFQNTFVKTNNNIGKIYCGLQEEEVYIGYTSNVRILNEQQTPYQLHVNGGLEINGILQQTNNFVTFIKYVYGDIKFINGLTHRYTKNISWEFEQITDYYPISIIGKIKCINDSGDYLWNRFELLISTKYDILTNKPNLLSVVDFVGYNTPNINSFQVSVRKSSNKAVLLTMQFTTSYTLTAVDYVSANIDIELIYNTNIGNITIDSVDESSDNIIYNPRFILRADQLSGTNNTLVSSWNNLSTFAVGGASLPILKTTETQRYVRFGTGVETSVSGNYIDLGTYTWPMITNGGFTYFGICRSYTTTLDTSNITQFNLFDFGTLNNTLDNTLQLSELYLPIYQDFNFYINKSSFTNTDSISVNRYHSTRPGTEWGLYGVRIQNNIPDEHSISLYRTFSSNIVQRSGNPIYTFEDTFITSNNFIGRPLSSFGNYQNIDIKEALWYDKYLDDSQVEVVISYLKNKYNLNLVGLFDSISLPERINSYSMRLLYNTYTGPILRVRRSTDNQEAEVYFDKDANVTAVIPLNDTAALYGTNALNTYKGLGNLYVHTWFDQMYRNDLQSLNVDEQPLLDTTDMYIYLNNTSNTINRLSYNNFFSLDNGTFIMDIKPIVHVDIANTRSITDWYRTDPIIAGNQPGGTDDFGIVLQQGDKFTLGLGPTDGPGVFTYTNGFNVQSIMAVSRTNTVDIDTILLYKDGGFADRSNISLYNSTTGVKTSLNPGYIGYDSVNGSRASVKLKSLLYFNEGTTVSRSIINQITRSLGNTIHNISGLIAWYDANSFDITCNVWYDMSENNYTIPSSNIYGTVQKGVIDNIYTLYGGTEVGIRFAETILPPTYTLFHVAKYNGTNREVIFDGLIPDWQSGFWYGAAGIAYHDDYLTSEIDVHGTDWVFSTDQNNLYRSNRVDRTLPGFQGGTSTQLTINRGYWYDEGLKSDWAVAEVIVYNRTLTLSEIEAVESYLDAKYNPQATPSTANIYVLFGAYNVGYFFGYNLDYSNYDRMTFTPNETEFWISSIRGLRCSTSYLNPTLPSTKTTFGIEFFKPDGTPWGKGALGSSNKFYMRIRNGSNAGKIIRIQDYNSTVESGTLQAATDPGPSRGEQYYFYFTASHTTNWYYLRSLYNNYSFFHNYSFIRPNFSTPVQTVDDAFLWMII